MTPQEAAQTIEVVKALRRFNSQSTIARRLELQLCGEILIALAPSRAQACTCQFLPGATTELSRAAFFGIILGRPGEGPQPWKLTI